VREGSSLSVISAPAEMKGRRACWATPRACLSRLPDFPPAPQEFSSPARNQAGTTKGNFCEIDLVPAGSIVARARARVETIRRTRSSPPFCHKILQRLGRPMKVMPANKEFIAAFELPPHIFDGQWRRRFGT